MLESEPGTPTCAPNKMLQRRHLKPAPNKKRPARKKPTATIIGAGRLGTALGIALKAAGYPVEAVVTKHAATAKRAARIIGSPTRGLPFSEYLASVSIPNRLLIIATPDDAIADVAAQLDTAFSQVSAKGRPQAGVALHTSGALSAELLWPLRKQGFATGSLHPLVSVSDARSGSNWLTRAYFSVEGDAPAVRLAKQIVRDLGARSFSIDPARKPLYHAAALMASPNMTALFDIALELLIRCGVSRDQAQRVLLPLVESTLENLSSQTPRAALTGTFKRRDVATVKKHIAAIEAQNLSEALMAYAILGQRSLSLAKSSTDPKSVEIQRLLSKLLRKRR